MRTEEEIKKAIEAVKDDEHLSHGYKEDIIIALEWVLGGAPFDPIDEHKDFKDK